MKQRLLNDARAKGDHFYNFKLEGIIIRSRARRVKGVEKKTKYFWRLDNCHKLFSAIYGLITEKNVVLTGPLYILQEGQRLFSALCN